MNAKQKLCCLMIATLTALVGCGSPCSGEFISQNESCAPGCQGFHVARVTPADCETTAMKWCAPQPEVVTDDNILTYWFNSETGDVYVTGGRLAQDYAAPSHLRRATSEEQMAVNQCLALQP